MQLLAILHWPLPSPSRALPDDFSFCFSNQSPCSWLTSLNEPKIGRTPTEHHHCNITVHCRCNTMCSCIRNNQAYHLPVFTLTVSTSGKQHNSFSSQLVALVKFKMCIPPMFDDKCSLCRRSPRISPSAVSMSLSETSMLDQADPLREEDSDLFAAATPRKVSPGSTTSSAAAETPVSVSAPAAPAAAPATDTEAGAAAAGAGPSARATAAAGDPTAARAEPVGSTGTVLLRVYIECVSHSITSQKMVLHGAHMTCTTWHGITQCGITWCTTTLRSITWSGVTMRAAHFCMLDSGFHQCRSVHLLALLTHCCS